MKVYELTTVVLPIYSLKRELYASLDTAMGIGAKNVPDYSSITWTKETDTVWRLYGKQNWDSPVTFLNIVIEEREVL